MALETDHPKPPPPPKEPQPKDKLPEEHDTTSGPRYGTTEGVKEDETQFEQVEVPKKPASNVDEDKDDKKSGKK